MKILVLAAAIGVCGPRVAPAIDDDGVAAFARLVAVASMRFPDDPTMRALILREADPSWVDPVSGLAAMELTDGALPIAALFDAPELTAVAVLDETSDELWCDLVSGQGLASSADAALGRLSVVTDPPEHVVEWRGEVPLASLVATKVEDERGAWPESWSVHRLPDALDPSAVAAVIGDGRVAVVPVDAASVTVDPLDGGLVGTGGGVYRIAWSPSHRYLAGWVWGPEEVIVFDLVGDAPPRRLAFEGEADGARWLAETDEIIGRHEGVMTVASAATGDRRTPTEADLEHAGTSERQDKGRSVGLSKRPLASKSGGRSLAHDVASGRLVIRDVSTGELVAETDVPPMQAVDEVRAVWSTEDRVIAWWSEGGTTESEAWVLAWDVGPESRVATRMHRGNLGITIGAGGSIIILHDTFDDGVTIWRPFDGPAVAEERWEWGRGRAFAIHPDGDRVAHASRQLELIHLHDLDWTRRRDRLWRRIPAILTPMQRMQYLGESWPRALETWKRQAVRTR